MKKTTSMVSSNSTTTNLVGIKQIEKIHEAILNQPFPNVKKLSEILEVSERTVKRYIAFLKFRFQAPIKYDKKNKGYYYAHLNWELPILPLEDTELFSFFVTIFLLQAKGQLYQDTKVKKALAKVASRLPEEVYANLSFLLENISIQEIPHVIVKAEFLEQLTTCATEKRTVEFDYYSPKDQKITHRKADILLVHNHEGDWYAISYDHSAKDFRDFHTGRISNFTETNEFFQTPKNWNRTEHLDGGFGMFRGGKMTEVEILFDSHQAQYIRERQMFHPNETREELPDGSLKLSFSVGEQSLEAVARFCLKYTGTCEALKPQKLREIIRDKLIKGLEIHQ